VPCRLERAAAFGPGSNGAGLVLESSLDTAAAAHPNPGRHRHATSSQSDGVSERHQRPSVPRHRRRVASASDDSGHGFDNVTVGDLSPSLLDRYISTARESAAGDRRRADIRPDDVIRLPPDLTQEEYVPGLPVGTRGGMSSPHIFTTMASTTSRSGSPAIEPEAWAASEVRHHTSCSCSSTGRSPSDDD